jgi:hypothetical protein
MKIVRVFGTSNWLACVRWSREPEHEALEMLALRWIITANLLHLREMGVYHTATAA